MRPVAPLCTLFGLRRRLSLGTRALARPGLEVLFPGYFRDGRARFPGSYGDEARGAFPAGASSSRRAKQGVSRLGSLLARWAEIGGRGDSESVLSLGPRPPAEGPPVASRGGGVGTVLRDHDKNCETTVRRDALPPRDRWKGMYAVQDNPSAGPRGSLAQPVCASRGVLARSAAKAGPSAFPSGERQYLLCVRVRARPWCARSW